MNPTVARGGSSFKGAFLYYMHDKKAKTRERVAWTHAVNILTGDADKAWKIMAYTAKNQERLKEAAGLRAGGRKLEKPVLAYSLSWHPEQKPDADHMRETALASLAALGLSEHEAMIIAHSDTPHRHVHIVANRVHPVTGKVASDSYTYRKLSDFALEYGQAHGLTTSPQRAENKKRREQGEKTAYHETKIAEAWAASDNGKSLMAALTARGFALAQGNKRLVVVDAYGKIHNPVRHIEGIKTKDFKERLKDVNIDGLPDAEGLAKEHAARHAQRKDTARKKDAPEKTPEPAQQKQAEPKDAGREEPQPANEPPRVPDRPRAPDAGKENPAPDTAPQAGTESDPEKVDWATLRLNQIQDRQIEDRAKVYDHHHRRILREREELTAYYRLAERRAEIETLRRKCEHPAWWRRLLGFAARDRAALETLSLNYENAQGRFAERIQSLEDERTRAMEALRVTQAREWETALRLHRPAIQPEPARERDAPQRARSERGLRGRGGYEHDR